MPMSPRVRVYMACSMDGFIAGPDDDLEWLHQSHAAPGDLAPDPAALRFDGFMVEIGAMLMGRTTYDVVERMGVWPYGETPVIVATRRPLSPLTNTVRTAEGSIQSLIAQARELAGERDVYLDGGDLVQQALNAGLVDEITATFVPVLLSQGTRLFDGLVTRTNLQFVGHHTYDDGLLQVTMRIRRP